MGLLSGRRRSATVRMHERGVVLESPRKQMLKLLSSVPEVKDKIDQKFMRNALQTKIFPDVEVAFIDRLVQKARMKNFRKGEVLFRDPDYVGIDLVEGPRLVGSRVARE